MSPESAQRRRLEVRRPFLSLQCLCVCIVRVEGHVPVDHMLQADLRASGQGHLAAYRWQAASQRRIGPGQLDLVRTEAPGLQRVETGLDGHFPLHQKRNPRLFPVREGGGVRLTGGAEIRGGRGPACSLPRERVEKHRLEHQGRRLGRKRRGVG